MSEITIIIPCLWASPNLYDITLESLEGIWTIPAQIIIMAGGTYTDNVNNGLKASTGDVIIVTNNDIVYMQPEWLEHLLKPLEEGYDISLIRQTDCDGWLTEDMITEGDKFGALFAMKREVYETIGGFDPQFKGYFGDLDYKKRAEDAGFRIGKNHAGLVEHEGKSTYKQIDPEDKEYKEATELFKKKWGSIW